MEPRPSRSGGGRRFRWAGCVEAGGAEGDCGLHFGERGKIVEQMREETRTQIRVLPRVHKLHRCVSSSEEIVRWLAMAMQSRKLLLSLHLA